MSCSAFSAVALLIEPVGLVESGPAVRTVARMAIATFAHSAALSAESFCVPIEVKNVEICSSKLSWTFGDCKGNTTAKMLIAALTTSVAGACGGLWSANGADA